MYKATLLLAAGLLVPAALATAQSGTLDPDFGTAGIHILAPIDSLDAGADVLPLADTTLLVCGTATVNGERTGFITHLLEDGTVDTNYGTANGYTYFGAGPGSHTVRMHSAADSSVYVCGMAYPVFDQYVPFLAHILADGSADPGFGVGGVVFLENPGLDIKFTDMALQPDGKIVLAGSIGLPPGGDALLLRMTPWGTMDSTFDGDGLLQVAASPDADGLSSVALLDDGSIIGAGSAIVNGDVRTLCVKADATGALVSGFDGDGVLLPNFPGSAHHATAVVSLGQQFVVAGTDLTDPGDDDVYVARFHSDGSPDAAFGMAGWTLTDVDNYEGVNDLHIQSDGKVLACGWAGPAGGLLGLCDILLVRYSTTGTLDATFGNGGTVLTDIEGKDIGQGLALQVDGKIVSAGSINSVFDAVVVRYLNDLNVGVEHEAASAGLVIHPVPVDAGAPITVRGAATNAPVLCWDASGRAVELSPTGAYATTFGTAHLKPGVYVLGIGEKRGRFVVAQ